MVSLGFYDNNEGKTALGANIAQQDTACSMFFMAEDSRRSWLHFLNACSSPRGGRAVPADVCCGGRTGLRRDEANGCGNREVEEEFEEMTRVKAGVRWVRQQLRACYSNQRHRGSSTVPGQGRGGFERVVGRGRPMHSWEHRQGQRKSVALLLPVCKSHLL